MAHEEKYINVSGERSWGGIITALIVGIILLFLVVYFVLPAIRNANSENQINVDVPEQINVQTPAETQTY